MKPWTVILRESPDSVKPSWTREAQLPIDTQSAWNYACYLYGETNVLAILPGSFKNRVCNGFISNNP